MISVGTCWPAVSITSIESTLNLEPVRFTGWPIFAYYRFIDIGMLGVLRFMVPPHWCHFGTVEYTAVIRHRYTVLELVNLTQVSTFAPKNEYQSGKTSLKTFLLLQQARTLHSKLQECLLTTSSCLHLVFCGLLVLLACFHASQVRIFMDPWFRPLSDRWKR